MHILVTGAANGIGAAITSKAAQLGHTVIAADLDAAGLAARWKDISSVQCRTLDVTSAQSWSALAESLAADRQEIDVLCNVAGVLRSGKTGQLRESDIDLMLDVNVKGVILGTDTLARSMIARRRGHIINIGSLASLYATPGTTVYAASKFAARGFSIAAAGDLRPHGIAVTLVGPGPVKTAMLEQQRGDENAALTFSGARALSVEEVADAILGPVLKKQPLEFFLPYSEGIFGRICNAAPGFFLSQVARARAKGRAHFDAESFR